MADETVNRENDDNNGKKNSEKRPSLETETLSKNSPSHSLDKPQPEVIDVSSMAEKKEIHNRVPDKPGDKLISDKGAIMRNPQRKSRSACRARSRDPTKCQPNFREMIGKHETRKEELEQLEGDLRERLDMLECSMPAVMVWNILRTAQGAPPSVVRRLMEKQFQGVHSAGNIAIPSTPSQHYDHRVREIEAERKEAVRRAEEARALLTDKEAAIEEHRKRLEEAKKCNQEKKERVERLNREAAEVRESMKNARGDDTSCQTGECGAIHCKEKLLADIGSLSSIGSTDLACFAKLQELAESEVCMKQQISELERREEVYMRTLQQADELWSKMEGESSSDIHELQQQLNLKTAANQQLADRVCQLEDEQEKLKKRLILCNGELAKFTDKVHANAEVGFKDGVATVTDHGTEAQAKTATTFTSASPQTFDVDSTALPQTKDKESTSAPESEEKAINVSTKTYDKDIEAVVDLIDREVDRPLGLGVDTGVGGEVLDDPTEKTGRPSERQSGRPTKVSPEEHKKKPATLGNLHWDDGYPPDTIPKDMVESSTGMDHIPLPKRVSTSEMPVQATVQTMERPVGGSEAEDVAEIIPEGRETAKSDPQQDTDLLSTIRAPEGGKKTPKMTQQYNQPVSQNVRVAEPPKIPDQTSNTIDDDKESEFDESIEVIDEPVTDELRFKKPMETRARVEEPVVDRKKTDTHETTLKPDGSASKRESVREPHTRGDKNSDAIIDKVMHKEHNFARKIQGPDSEKKRVSKRGTTIDEDNDAVSDQMERHVQAQRQDSDETLATKRRTTTEKRNASVNDQVKNKVPESKQKPSPSEYIEKRINQAPAQVDEDSEEAIDKKKPRAHATTQKKDRSPSDERDHNKSPTRVSRDRNAGTDQTEPEIVQMAQEPDEPISTGKRVSKRPTKGEEDNKKNSTTVDKGDRVSVEKSDYPDSDKKDSPSKRRKKVSKKNEVIPDEMEYDSEEDAKKADYSDSEEEVVVKKRTKSVTKNPKEVEKKERKDRSSKHKARNAREVETDDDEDIPEAWKNWDWDKGCPPDGGCNISDSPTRLGDKRRKDVSTLESQVQATVEMRERSVGGRGSQDIAEINREDKPTRDKIEKGSDATPAPTGERTDQIVLPREELRNWYNTINSIHHTISQCDNCQFQVEATSQLMGKINNHLWIMALADEELPITDDEMRKSLAYMTERPIESVRDLGAHPGGRKKREVSTVSNPEIESVPSGNSENLLPNTSQLLGNDEKLPGGTEETLDISTARLVTLSEDGSDIAKPIDKLGTLTEAEPSQSDIEKSLLDEDETKMPAVSSQLSTPQAPVEEELSMPLGKERPSLSRKEPLEVIDPEDQQPENAVPSAMKEEEIPESEEKQGRSKEPAGETIGAAEPREEEKRKRDDADKSRAPKPERSGACVCSPLICRPVITCIPEPYTEGTQTSPQMPRTLDRLKLKAKTGRFRPPPDTIIWSRPLIWTRRREDKSTLTTTGVGTQADGTVGRERLTQRKKFGESEEHPSRRHPVRKSPTPLNYAAAEFSDLLRPQLSTASNEHEIAVTQYTGKSLTPKNSDLCCVDCGRPITPESPAVSSKANLRAGTRSQKKPMHSFKKLTTSTSRIERRENLCCVCKVSHEIRKGTTAEDLKAEVKKGSTSDEELGCPSDKKNKRAQELTKPSKKKRKPEKKDQGVTANISRTKRKKIIKNEKNVDGSLVTSKPESQIHSPSIKSKHSGNSVTGSCDETSCNKIPPKTEETVKPSAPKISSSCTPSPCGCSDNSSLQVPYTNYSALFKTNINKNDSECSSCNESATQQE